jgi:PqqD family protein of HPr-rel-A system
MAFPHRGVDEMAALKPIARGDLAIVELDGEAVIYDERTGNLHRLNRTATLVFGLCDGSATVKTMAEDVAGAFNVPAEEIERQIRSLLRSLRKAGLLDGSGGREARTAADNREGVRRGRRSSKAGDG